MLLGILLELRGIREFKQYSSRTTLRGNWPRKHIGRRFHGFLPRLGARQLTRSASLTLIARRNSTSWQKTALLRRSRKLFTVLRGGIAGHTSVPTKFRDFRIHHCRSQPIFAGQSTTYSRKLQKFMPYRLSSPQEEPALTRRLFHFHPHHKKESTWPRTNKSKPIAKTRNPPPDRAPKPANPAPRKTRKNPASFPPKTAFAPKINRNTTSSTKASGPVSAPPTPSKKPTPSKSSALPGVSAAAP